MSDFREVAFSQLSKERNSVGGEIRGKHDSQTHDSRQIGGNSSVAGASFNFINSIVGAGIVALPLAIQECGLLVGVFMLTTVAILVHTSVIMLIECGIKVKRLDLEDLCEHLLGRKGYYFALVFMFLFAYGAQIAYLVIIADTVPLVAELLFPNSFLCNRRLALISFASFGVLPLSMLKDLSSLSWTSLLSIISVLVLIIAVIIAILSNKESESTDHFQSSDALVVNSSVFAGVGSMSFAFVCQHNSFLVFRSLRQPSLAEWRKVANASIFFAYTVSLLLALIGYFAFYPYLDGDLLNNFPVGFISIAIARCLLAINMVFTYPMELYVTRHCIWQLYEKSRCGSNVVILEGESSSSSCGLGNRSHNDNCYNSNHEATHASDVNHCISSSENSKGHNHSSSSNIQHFTVHTLFGNVIRSITKILDNNYNCKTTNDNINNNNNINKKKKTKKERINSSTTNNNNNDDDDNDEDDVSILFVDNKVLMMYDVSIDDNSTVTTKAVTPTNSAVVSAILSPLNSYISNHHHHNNNIDSNDTTTNKSLRDMQQRNSKEERGSCNSNNNNSGSIANTTPLQSISRVSATAAATLMTSTPTRYYHPVNIISNDNDNTIANSTEKRMIKEARNVQQEGCSNSSNSSSSSSSNRKCSSSSSNSSSSSSSSSSSNRRRRKKYDMIATSDDVILGDNNNNNSSISGSDDESNISNNYHNKHLYHHCINNLRDGYNDDDGSININTSYDAGNTNNNTVIKRDHNNYSSNDNNNYSSNSSSSSSEGDIEMSLPINYNNNNNNNNTMNYNNNISSYLDNRSDSKDTATTTINKNNHSNTAAMSSSTLSTTNNNNNNNNGLRNTLIISCISCRGLLVLVQQLFSHLRQQLPHIFLTLLLWGSSLGIAMVAKELGTVSALTGALAASVLGYMLPAVLYLKAYEEELKLSMNEISMFARACSFYRYGDRSSSSALSQISNHNNNGGDDDDNNNDEAEIEVISFNNNNNNSHGCSGVVVSNPMKHQTAFGIATTAVTTTDFDDIDNIVITTATRPSDSSWLLLRRLLLALLMIIFGFAALTIGVSTILYNS